VKAILFFGLVLGLCLIGAALTHKPRESRSATVLIKRPNGHGSGVHIGNGYILTASHVVKGEGAIEIATEDGSSAPARLVWISTDYDVALLHVDNLSMGRATLDCRSLRIGENIEAVGNPLDLQFIHTYGKVAGEPRTVDELRSVFIASLSVVPGMSGGPVFDRQGHLIGIITATMAVPLSLITSSLVPVSYIIPGSAICNMLVRS